MFRMEKCVVIVSSTLLLSVVGCSMGPRATTARNQILIPLQLVKPTQVAQQSGNSTSVNLQEKVQSASSKTVLEKRKRINLLIARETSFSMVSESNGSGSAKKKVQVTLKSGPAPKMARSLPQLSKTPTPLIANATATTPQDEAAPLPPSEEPGKFEQLETPDISMAQPELSITTELAIPSELPVEMSSANTEEMLIVSTPTLLPESWTTTSGETVVNTSVSVDEPKEFFLPIVRTSVEASSSVETFFGDFRVEMIDSLKLNRDQFQSGLLKVVTDRTCDIERRARAVFLLGESGRDAYDAVPVLRREMHREVDRLLVVDLADAILKIQGADDDSIDTLLKCLKSPETEVRRMATVALRSTADVNQKRVIDALQETLTTEDLKLRRIAFLTLAHFGTAAQQVVPELKSAIETGDTAMREVAMASLACIAPESVE